MTIVKDETVGHYRKWIATKRSTINGFVNLNPTACLLSVQRRDYLFGLLKRRYCSTSAAPGFTSCSERALFRASDLTTAAPYAFPWRLFRVSLKTPYARAVTTSSAAMSADRRANFQAYKSNEATKVLNLTAS